MTDPKSPLAMTLLSPHKNSGIIAITPIKTFEEISEGLHPEVPLPLKQMVWVSLGLKKWGGRSGRELQ